LSSIGTIWLVCDLDGTNFNKIYGRFKEIGLLHVGTVFDWLYESGLDGQSGIDGKLLKLILYGWVFFLFFISLKKW